MLGHAQRCLGWPAGSQLSPDAQNARLFGHEGNARVGGASRHGSGLWQLDRGASRCQVDATSRRPRAGRIGLAVEQRNGERGRLADDRFGRCQNLQLADGPGHGTNSRTVSVQLGAAVTVGIDREQDLLPGGRYRRGEMAVAASRGVAVDDIDALTLTEAPASHVDPHHEDVALETPVERGARRFDQGLPSLADHGRSQLDVAEPTTGRVDGSSLNVVVGGWIGRLQRNRRVARARVPFVRKLHPQTRPGTEAAGACAVGHRPRAERAGDTFERIQGDAAFVARAADALWQLLAGQPGGHEQQAGQREGAKRVSRPETHGRAH